MSEKISPTSSIDQERTSVANGAYVVMNPPNPEVRNRFATSSVMTERLMA
jgi:hypothetical protein